jgi:hypothetical protein
MKTVRRRLWAVSVAALTMALAMAMALASQAAAASRPGAVVKPMVGKPIFLSGAVCHSGRLSFGFHVLALGTKGKGIGFVVEPFKPGRRDVIDGGIDLRPNGVHEALSGTVHVNADGRSGTFNVWGRDGNGPTGDRFTGTWRCPA